MYRLWEYSALLRCISISNIYFSIEHNAYIMIDMRKDSSLLCELLKRLKVKHTDFYLNKLYEEHPHKYNLFGLSRILKDYGIDNDGYRVEDKDELGDLKTPFVAQYNHQLIIVLKLTETDVYYYIDGKEFSISLFEFKDKWSGVILLISDHRNAIEPEYKSNIIKEYYFRLLKLILILSIIIIPILLIISNSWYNDIGMMNLFVLNFLGTYIGYLLILKQVKIHSTSADRICSIFKKSDCNNVLESKAAKLWGIIGWSEVGLGYFLSNLIIISLYPALLSYLALINVCALPYSLWSIWYQKIKIKQWCALCIIVQILFYCMFVNNLIFKYIRFPEFCLSNWGIVVFVYILPFCFISVLLPVIIKSHQVSYLKHAFNNLKMTNDVFEGLLYSKDRYAVEGVSQICFGNSNAKNQITIVSNPHCEPCGIAHEKINNLLNYLGEDNLYIQFVFINFDKDEIRDSGKFLIASYLNGGPDFAKDLFNRWFTSERYEIRNTYAKYSFNLNTKDVLDEQQKHEKWSKQNKVSLTPTVLYNGYILPDIYNIDDLRLLL